MDVRVGAATNVGRVRDHNEDSFCVNRKHRIFIVADGMGGHAAGEIASNQLKDYIEEYLLREDRPGSIAECLVEGIQAANRAIYQMGIDDAQKRGMGTTATILTSDESQYYVAQVGDSRCYRLRDGTLEQLTRDHSRVFQLYESGLITKDEIEDHPLSNVITRSIGNHATVDPDIYEGEIRPGDRYLLCSDGLTGEVRDAQLQAVLETHKDPQEAVDILIEAALENGGKDNVTVVVLDFKEGEDERRKTVPMTLDQLKSLPAPPGSKDREDWSKPTDPAAEEPAGDDAPEGKGGGAPAPEAGPGARPDRTPTPLPRRRGRRRDLDTPAPLPEPGSRGGEGALPSRGPDVVRWAVVILVLGALAMFLSTEGSPSGLALSTTPEGAEVYVDGRFRGSSPQLLPALEPGPHTVQIRLEGYATRELRVRVPESGQVKKHVLLEPAPGAAAGSP